MARALEDRIRFREPLRRALGRLFPGPWSFLLGEVSLFSFVGLVLSGAYLALFYDPGRAYASAVEAAGRVPFALVAHRFIGRSARRFAIGVVAAFIFLLLTFWITNLRSPLHHSNPPAVTNGVAAATSRE